MPQFVVERDIPGVGKSSPQELQAIVQKSCGVPKAAGSPIQWIESYATENTLYCICVAPNEDVVMQYAAQGGLPATAVSRVHSVDEPTFAE